VGEGVSGNIVVLYLEGVANLKHAAFTMTYYNSSLSENSIKTFISFKVITWLRSITMLFPTVLLDRVAWELAKGMKRNNNRSMIIITLFIFLHL